jgi:hypothetical protein
VKWIFLLALIVATPMLAVYLRGNPRHLPYVGLAVGISPFLLSGLNLAASPISWAHWPGPVKGLDVSLLDGIAIALIFATKPARTPIWIKISFATFAAAAILATALSDTWQASVFYLWQLARAVLVYLAVTRAVAMSPTFALQVVNGLMAGAILQAGVAASQYAGGNTQAGGWFGHRNLLGMASHFAVYPAMALLLGGVQSRWAALTVACGFIIAFSGGSRATIGLIGLGIVMTVFFSRGLRPSGRKSAIAGGIFILILISAPFLVSAIQRRSEAQLAASNLERENMITAAKMIITDYPLGVGPNRYVIVANVGGYSDRAGVAWNPANREAPVHNSYYLVTAEMGWIGLLGLISLLGSLAVTAFAALRLRANGVEGDLIVGATATLFVFYIHSYFEWITMYYHIHYLFAIDAGLLIGLYCKLTKERSRRGSLAGAPKSRAEPGTSLRPA